MGKKWLVHGEGRIQNGIQEQKKYINNIKWNNIWCSDGLPKVNVFFWILSPCKTLTTDNLRKRGIVATICCILCKESEENLEHVFTECKFMQKVWTNALRELKMNITMPTNWNDLFFSWKDYYQGSFNQKSDFIRAWEALPRFICWKIWTTRNKGIFGVSSSANKVSISAKSLWVDSLSTRGMKSINKEPLAVEERAWMVDLLGHPSSCFWSNPTKKPSLSTWQIRMSNEYFQNWWDKIGIGSLFFYGASKGNPGLAGVGRVISDSKGNK